jgi:IS1 family transposase
MGKLSSNQKGRSPRSLLIQRKVEPQFDNLRNFWREKCFVRQQISRFGPFRVPVSGEIKITFAEGDWKICWVHQLYHDPNLSRTLLHDFPVNKIHPLIKRGFHEGCLALHQRSLFIHEIGLSFDSNKGATGNKYADGANRNKKSVETPRPPVENVVQSGLVFIRYGHRRTAGEFYAVLGILGCYFSSILLGVWGLERFSQGHHWSGGSLLAFAVLLNVGATGTGGSGCLPWQWWDCLHRKTKNADHNPRSQRHGLNVSQKQLTPLCFLYYNNDMANVLSTDKQAGIIGALCEGSSIRSIERMTGVHRDTIMRLGVRVGHGCMELMDETMRGLSSTRLEMDEIWGFVGKKQKNVGLEDDPSMGDVWTFCAIDADTKLVPSFLVGKRDKDTANAFLQDISGRMNNRLQISTDGLAAYGDAIANAFGNDVDYAQIIKTYGHQEISNNRRYSAPDFVSSEKVVVIGNPDNDLISTSYVERLNATTRLHMRRLTRLTLAFSKKLDNFEAAVGLHFAYYNFVKKHSTVKCTPAMAAGVATDYWTVADLVRTAA